MGSVAEYQGLVTPQHKTRPKFMAAVAALTSGHADLQTVLLSMPGLYDFDAAAGAQLDAVGEWVGLTRYADVPGTGITALGDADYRVLLRARLLGDHWDGGMESLQVILRSLFPGTPIVLYAVDNQDMSMDVYITGGTPTPTQIALMKGGLLIPKPEGVRINLILVTGGPLFGFDTSDQHVDGFDVGSFATYL